MGKIKEAKIETKTDRWHVRNRTAMYLGSNDMEELDTYIYEKDKLVFKKVQFQQAKIKAIEELLDNSIDEFYRGHVTEVKVTLKDDLKTVIVEDNGIGFPINKIEDVYTTFKTGSKFQDIDVDEKGFLFRTLGQNGVGAAATCLTSDKFIATIKHLNSKKEKTVEFLDGAEVVNRKRTKNFASRRGGVRVEVVLSEEVYGDNKIDPVLLRKRLKDLAYNNPKLTFSFNGEKFLSKRGLVDLASSIDPEKSQHLILKSYTFEGKNKKGKYKAKYDLDFSILIDEKSSEREKIISFVNSTPTYDGGFHHDKLRRVFINSVKDKLSREAKKNKIQLNDNDVMEGIVFVFGVIMPNPRFESQTKRKMTKDRFLEKSIEDMYEEILPKFFRKNKSYLERVIERAKKRNTLEILKEAGKQGKKQSAKRIEKLMDANARKNREKCTLFICEGDSAVGGLRIARDNNLHGGIALKGKPLNVKKESVKKVLENKEFADIMASIGLVIGKTSEEVDLRFGKIVFLSDSDVDGGHINTLLINFFFRFWPEMYEKGMIEIAKAPLYEVVTNRGTFFAEDDEELEKLRKGKTVKEIHRNKGLGEMSKEAWNYLMSKDTYYKL